MCPVAVIKFYLSVTNLQTKSEVQVNIDYFAYQLLIGCWYINSSVMFFIYTLRGKLFRIELIRLFRRLLCCHQQNLLCHRVPRIIWTRPTEHF